MKSFDELKAMSDQEKMAYLHYEAEKLIANAAPHNQLKMRSLQAKCDSIRRHYKAPSLACAKMVELMQERLMALKTEWGRLA